MSSQGEWTPFQTHYSENVVPPGIEPGPLDLQPGTLTTRPQRWQGNNNNNNNNNIINTVTTIQINTYKYIVAHKPVTTQ
jgi:hypothetical protein